jgi:hypothetical protein
VREWSEIVERLREGPTDNGLDLSQYRTVIPLVCTPSPLYTDDAAALSEVAPGLRACSSLLELEEWLMGSGLSLPADPFT